MFPTLRHRIGATLLDRIDLALELSTLGAYGLGDDGRPLALDRVAPSPARGRDRCEPYAAASGEVSRDRRAPCDRRPARCAGPARA